MEVEESKLGQDLFEALNCVFNFNEHEAKIYFTLVNNPLSTSITLASILEKDRSWTQRGLNTLLSLGLVKRHYKILEKGGYVYQYEAIPLEVAKEKIKSALDEWCRITMAKIETGIKK